MGDGLGGKIGTRVAEINTRAKLATLDRATPLFVKTGMALQEEFFRLTGSEIRQTIGPMYRVIGNHPGAPKEFADTLNFLADGHGQWATLLAGATTSQIIGTGIGAIIQNWLQPLISANLSGDPNSLLSVSDAAAVNIRGVGGGLDLVQEALNQGIADDRFRAIEALASGVLDPGSIIELLNREIIDPTTAMALFKRIGWSHDHADYLMKLRRNILSIVDIAAMANRDIITQDQGRDLAGLAGWTAADFDKFNLLGGEPPDVTSLILAWRRNVVDENDVIRALIQGPLRKEWIPVIMNLRWEPLAPQEAANAVNQGHMSLEAATRAAEESGVRPEDFQVIIDNAGLPPGPQEALDWVNRGMITESDFRSIFLESRIKNKYIDLYLESRTTILTMSETRSLFAKGVMTHDQALARLVARGYTAEDSEIILAGASHEKTQAARDLTVSQVVQLYLDHLIDQATALAMIGQAGYDEQESQWYLDLADMRRATRFMETAISHTRSLFVGYHIDAGQASSALDKLQVPTDGRDQLVSLWTIERSMATKELTTAEILGAVKLDLLLSGPAYDRLQGHGYTPGDALIKLKLGKVLQPTDTVEALQWPNQ